MSSLDETPVTSSFVNIDLDDNVNQEMEGTSLNQSSLSASGEDNIDNEKEKVVNEETQTRLSITSISEQNEQLDRLAKQLTEDYCKYFCLNPTSQINELNECIEDLLGHMEEFYGLVEMIRTESNACIDELTETLQSKLDQCRDLFRLVDKLERIVNHVALQLSLMEREVSKAEGCMGKQNPVKKLFSLISQTANRNVSGKSIRGGYLPPDIFKTEDLMKL